MYENQSKGKISSILPASALMQRQTIFIKQAALNKDMH
jgi:hypothetical protein